MSIVSSGAFQGLGRGLPFLFLNALRLLGIAAPLGWMLARTRGEYGLHYAPLIASGCSALVAVTWILSATSRLRRRERPAPVPVAAAAA
jgi:Na+-driven multidrug efflux pump